MSSCDGTIAAFTMSASSGLNTFSSEAALIEPNFRRFTKLNVVATDTSTESSKSRASRANRLIASSMVAHTSDCSTITLSTSPAEGEKPIAPPANFLGTVHEFTVSDLPLDTAEG